MKNVPRELHRTFNLKHLIKISHDKKQFKSLKHDKLKYFIMNSFTSSVTKFKTNNCESAKTAKIDLAAILLSVVKIIKDPSKINKPELIHKVTETLRNKKHILEESNKLKLTRTSNPDDTATLKNTTNEVPANTKHMLDSICDNEDTSTSTNQNYIIDVPDIIEMMDTQYPDPMSNTV